MFLETKWMFVFQIREEMAHFSEIQIHFLCIFLKIKKHANCKEPNNYKADIENDLNPTFTEKHF
jgi:hypothetical protein